MKDKLLANITYAINHFLALEAKNSALLPKLIGSCYKIEVTDLKQELFLVFTESGVNAYASIPAQVPDAIISGRIINLIGSSVRSDPAHINITGDKRKAKLLIDILKKIDLPVNQLIKNTLGEKAAYWADSIFSKMLDTVKQCKTNASENVSSYIQEEKGLTVSREEFNEFKSSVKKCRDKLARLEKCV